MPIVFRALKQILQNQMVLMECVYDIALIVSRRLEPGDSDDLHNDARAMLAQYIPTDMRIKEL